MTATDLEGLYPFLYADGGALEGLLESARRSTEAKTAEITELRAELARRHGARLESAARQLAGRFAAGGRLLTFGNGGSSTDAQELATLFLHPGGDQRPLPAIALANDTAVMTALSNDVGFEVTFSRQIAAFARPADIAVGISTSGNSANLLLGLEEAARRGLMTVGIAGYDGGRMAELTFLDHLFTVPSPSVHRVQEAQTTLYHALWELTVAALAPADSPADRATAPADSPADRAAATSSAESAATAPATCVPVPAPSSGRAEISGSH